ncbi:cathepsin K-like [Lepisosteus oculatus]|uniref:cathepsin K-like n=1 Tax=Lepisosteus oculatus TaxID=7918 RepID=UPI00371501A8
MKAVIFLASVVLCLHLGTCIDPSLDLEWENWKIKHKKPTNRADDQQRREIWEKNYGVIESHNKRYREGKETYEMGMNRFGDLTTEEFVKLTKIRSKMSRMKLPRSTNVMLSATDLRLAASKLNVTSIDYRTMGYVTPVQDQGICGCCYAFSAAGALEAQWKKKTGTLITLSKQQLIDCSTSEGNIGCTGGHPHLSYDYIIKNGGIQAETTYPYAMQNQICTADKSKIVATLSDWKFLPIGDEQALQDALVTIGPVAVAVDGSTINFQFYRQGIFSDSKCNIWKLSHATVLIGFGTEGSANYWTIKNSWGPYWGENGYFRLAKNKGSMCGISQYGVVPFV